MMHSTQEQGQRTYASAESISGGRILLVDDEPNALKVLSAILGREGYKVFESDSGSDAIEVLGKEQIDAVVTDLRMPGMDGMQFFEHMKDNYPDIPVIFLTAYGSVESAVYAMTRGAFYYFIKPPDYLKLKGLVARAVEQHRLRAELKFPRCMISGGNYKIVGRSPALRKLIQTVETVKDSGSSVLIYGETGTGKELLARSLHFGSKRRELPFVAVNCAAIPGELMESEFFGYEKGAFTGAFSRRTGKFEEAASGTVFLDEISELELPMQAKLLRVLQEREIERRGSNRKIKVRFRLISSTNLNLAEAVGQNRFREDLFYRINVVELRVPPLRERKEDIPFLITEFMNEFCTRERKDLSVSDQALKLFERYDWPGNIRQLKNIIERAVVLARAGTITERELPEELLALRKKTAALDKPKSLKELERQAVKITLQQCKGNKSRAAKLLGISRKAFYKKLREAGG